MIDLLAIMRSARRREPAQEATAPPESPLMRFLTLGDAVVEVRRHTFRTRYTRRGYAPVNDDYRDCDGYQWQCLGCGGTSEHNDAYDPGYLACEERQARDDANGHAGTCRSMPKTGAS